MIKVKICCISSVEEAKLVIKYGADAIGLVGKMPSGPGPISDELIQKITTATPPPISSFLLTSETSAAGIIAHHQRVHTSVIQIVDELKKGTYADIRAALPAVKLVQVIHVLGEESIAEALEIAPHVDALLLDSGQPNAAIKTLGGTGNTHNWEVSRQIVEQSPKPVFLAGGLNASNVRTAIETVQPYGVDLCSSVRKNGDLDEELLSHFFETLAR